MSKHRFAYRSTDSFWFSAMQQIEISPHAWLWTRYSTCWVYCKFQVLKTCSSLSQLNLLATMSRWRLSLSKTVIYRHRSARFCSAIYGWNVKPGFIRDPIRVPRIENRVRRIRENHHRVSKIKENRVPRIREIGSLQVLIGYITFSLKKTLGKRKRCSRQTKYKSSGWIPIYCGKNGQLCTQWDALRT